MEYEECEIETKDNIKLHAWLVFAKKDHTKCRTLIYFHGSAGNFENRLFLIHNLRRENTNILIVAYRGFGSSQGVSTEEGLEMDA